MSRRNLLTLVELTLVTAALAAALGLLAHAANVGHTQWAAAAFAGVITALSLLLPTTLALLLQAVWLHGPGTARAIRRRMHDWRQWRGIQRADTTTRRPGHTPQGTMATRPRTAHAHPGRHR